MCHLGLVRPESIAKRGCEIEIVDTHKSLETRVNAGAYSRMTSNKPDTTEVTEQQMSPILGAIILRGWCRGRPKLIWKPQRVVAA